MLSNAGMYMTSLLSYLYRSMGDGTRQCMYLTYVEAADADRREWEEIREPHEQDQIRENFDIFGHLCK